MTQQKQVNRSNSTNNTPLSIISSKARNKEKTFSQLGLLVGGFTRWKKTSDSEQPEQLKNLIQWTLSDKFLSNQRLGVFAEGFALIYYTILQSLSSLSNEQQQDLDVLKDAFTALGTPDSILKKIEEHKTNTFFSYDYIPLKDNQILDLLHEYTAGKSTANLSAGFLQRVGKEPILPHFGPSPHRRKYIWLTDNDSNLWVEAIKETLKDLNTRADINLYEMMRLVERFECCVFFTLDIDTLRRHSKDIGLQRVVDAIGDMHRQGQGKKLKELYFSWDLLAFDYRAKKDDSDSEELLYRTVLALWAKKPDDEVWAPLLPGQSAPSSPFSQEEARYLLTRVFPELRTYFLENIREKHKFTSDCKQLQTKYEAQTCYPPTFYFADPTSRLSTTSAYVQNATVKYLLRYCLGYDDPQADKLSWSTLEGSLAAVRGEQVHWDHYKPRYLLLPLLGEDREELGADIDNVVDVLSLREYMTTLEAIEINDKLKTLSSDISTAEVWDDIVARLIRIVPAFSDAERENCFYEFAPLQLGLGRIQFALEEMRREVTRLEQRYKAFISRIKGFLGEYVIIAPVPHLPSIPIAMEDAHLPASLQQPMKTVSRFAETLSFTNERIHALLTLLSTIANDHARRRKEVSGRIITVAAVIISLASLLETFLPKDSIPNTLGPLLQKFGTLLSLRDIQVSVITLALLILVFIFFQIKWWKERPENRCLIKYKIKHESQAFHGCIQRLWWLIVYEIYIKKDEKKHLIVPILDPAPASWFRSANDDNIDERATNTLKDLWRYLEKSPSTGLKMKELDENSNREKIIGEDIVCMARRYLYSFILYPQPIPLPRTLCLMHYKSIQLFGKSTIIESHFRKSLLVAGFTEEQIKFLITWLDDEQGGNLKHQIERYSADEIAKALKDKQVKVPPPANFGALWTGNLKLPPK